MKRAKTIMGRGAFVRMTGLCLVAAPSAAFASDAPQPFSPPRDPASFERALQCLTEAVYYEARSESDEGQRAVAQVVLNRVRHPAYPNSVCGVVYQGSQRQTGCQFTFTCDGSMGGYIDAGAWALAQRIADAALQGSVYRPVGLALNYHTTAIRPYWAPSLVRQAVVGSHIFYRRPGSGSAAAFRQAPSESEPGSGYASAGATPRAARERVTRASANYQPARLEMATVERPRVEKYRVERPRMERALFERPGVERSRNSVVRSSATASQGRPASRAEPAPGRRGPRTTIESGVRVSRGS